MLLKGGIFLFINNIVISYLAVYLTGISLKNLGNHKKG